MNWTAQGILYILIYKKFESLCCTPETKSIVNQLYPNGKKKFNPLKKERKIERLLPSISKDLSR